MSDIKLLLSNVKRASRSLMSLTDARRAEILMRLADAVDSSHEVILRANAEDLSRMERSNPLYDRLLLSPKRLTAIAGDIRHVAELPSPVGEVIEDRTLPNGLRLRRVRVPFGVIGVIYEARPNVTFDVFSLCFRSGNACVLKGGSDASASNEAIVSLIHKVLDECGVDTDCVCLLPSSHEATAAMLGAVGYVDVCIPRGGRRLIDFVRDNARVPVIETGAGVVSAYFDKDGDIDMGRDIITNAKTRRVSVCNALDTLLIHHNRLADLPLLCERLSEKMSRYLPMKSPVMLWPDIILLHCSTMPMRRLTRQSGWTIKWESVQSGLLTMLLSISHTMARDIANVSLLRITKLPTVSSSRSMRPVSMSTLRQVLLTVLSSDLARKSVSAPRNSVHEVRWGFVK